MSSRSLRLNHIQAGQCVAALEVVAYFIGNDLNDLTTPVIEPEELKKLAAKMRDGRHELCQQLTSKHESIELWLSRLELEVFQVVISDLLSDKKAVGLAQDRIEIVGSDEEWLRFSEILTVISNQPKQNLEKSVILNQNDFDLVMSLLDNCPLELNDRIGCNEVMESVKKRVDRALWLSGQCLSDVGQSVSYDLSDHDVLILQQCLKFACRAHLSGFGKHFELLKEACVFGVVAGDYLRLAVILSDG